MSVAEFINVIAYKVVVLMYQIQLLILVIVGIFNVTVLKKLNVIVLHILKNLFWKLLM